MQLLSVITSFNYISMLTGISCIIRTCNYTVKWKTVFKNTLIWIDWPISNYSVQRIGCFILYKISQNFKKILF